MEQLAGSIVLVEARRRDGLPALRRGAVVAASPLVLGIELRPGTLADVRAPIGSQLLIGRPGAADARPHTVLAARAGRDGLVVTEVAPPRPSDGDRRRHARARVTSATLRQGGQRLLVTDIGAGGLRLAEPIDHARGALRLEFGGRAVELEAQLVDPHRLRFDTPIEQLDAHGIVQAVTLELSPAG
ncbi:MAG: hypothetical protein AAGA99_16125 [Actinomycetota bacterium]